MDLPPPPVERLVVLCAWCASTAGSLLPPEQISHGMCPGCLARWRLGARDEEEPEAPPG